MQTKQSRGSRNSESRNAELSKAGSKKAESKKAESNRAESQDASGTDETEQVNAVRLVGRVSAEPEHRELPSGDELVQLRVVVRRPPVRRRAAASSREPGSTAAPRAQVDTIDVTCWTAAARRSALRLRAGQVVEVHGALRRRFFKAGAVTQSRYEVEAALIRRVVGPAGAPVS